MLALIQGAGEIDCVSVSSVVNETLPNGTIQEVTQTNVWPQYEEPLFSVRVYFTIISGIIALSAVSFVTLNQWGYCRSEFVKGSGDDEEKEKTERNGNGVSKASSVDSFNGAVHGGYLSGDDQASSSREVLQQSSELSLRGNTKCRMRSTMKNLIHLGNLSGAEFFLLLFIVFVVNMTLTTFLPSVQTYTVLPYGLEYYHLTTSLVQMANPAACFFALFVLAEKLWVISVITVLGQGIVAYLIYLAAESPHPPMHDQSGGGQIAVSFGLFFSSTD